MLPGVEGARREKKRKEKKKEKNVEANGGVKIAGDHGTRETC